MTVGAIVTDCDTGLPRSFNPLFFKSDSEELDTCARGNT